MKNKKTALTAKVIGTMAFLSVFILNIMVFVQKDGKSGALSFKSLKAHAQSNGTGEGASGWGYVTRTVQCPSPTYDATVTNTTYAGTGGVYVEAGGTIPNSGGIKAAVSGTYNGTESATYSTYKTPTSKDVCDNGSFYQYCTILSCRVKVN